MNHIALNFRLIPELKGVNSEYQHQRYHSMSTVSGARHAPRRQSQDGSTDKVVVNLDASSPVVGSRRGVSTSAGARTSPIDVEALEDEVQAVSPSQVPPQVYYFKLS